MSYSVTANKIKLRSIKLIYIENIPIYATEPRTILSNNSSVCSDKHTNLWRAIARSKMCGEGKNYVTGQEIKMCVEFYCYNNNSIFVCEESEEFVFVVIKDGIIAGKTQNVEDEIVKKIFAENSFSIYDGYGRELIADSYLNFCSLIDKVTNMRSKFRVKLDLYHSFRDTLQDYRRERQTSFNGRINEDFDMLITLCDDISKEFSELLYCYHEEIEEEYRNSCFKAVTEKHKLSSILGIYISALRAYMLNYDSDPLSVEERIYMNFMREFSLFLGENPTVVDDYIDCFGLKKREADEVRELIKSEQLDTPWQRQYAEITML